MKITLIKGPNFETAERNAYRVLHQILTEQALEDLKKESEKAI